MSVDGNLLGDPAAARRAVGSAIESWVSGLLSAGSGMAGRLEARCLCFQRMHRHLLTGQVVDNSIPENFVGGSVILVPQSVSHRSDRLPRDIRGMLPEVVGDVPACLRNDFHRPLKSKLGQAICNDLVAASPCDSCFDEFIMRSMSSRMS